MPDHQLYHTRMCCDGQFSVGLFDLQLSGCWGNAQIVVIRCIGNHVLYKWFQELVTVSLTFSSSSFTKQKEVQVNFASNDVEANYFSACFPRDPGGVSRATPLLTAEFSFPPFLPFLLHFSFSFFSSSFFSFQKDIRVPQSTQNGVHWQCHLLQLSSLPVKINCAMVHATWSLREKVVRVEFIS